MSSSRPLRLLSCLVLAAPALATAASVDVGASASARLTGITFTAYDLNPSDGTPAGYSFVIDPTMTGGQIFGPAGTIAGTNTYRATSQGYDPAYDVSDRQEAPGLAFAPLQSSANNSESAATAISQATSQSASANFQRSLTDNAPPDPYGYYWGATSGASAGTFVDASGYLDGTTVGYLEVAAHTVLEITGQGQVSGTSTFAINDCPTCYYQGNTTVAAAVEMQLQPDGDGINSETHSSRLEHYESFDSLSTSFDETGTLRLTYVNNTGSAQRVRFWVGTTASAGFGANLTGLPTPEPGTYALMGIGLGASAWVARRRRAA